MLAKPRKQQTDKNNKNVNKIIQDNNFKQQSNKYKNQNKDILANIIKNKPNNSNVILLYNIYMTFFDITMTCLDSKTLR